MDGAQDNRLGAEKGCRQTAGRLQFTTLNPTDSKYDGITAD